MIEVKFYDKAEDHLLKFAVIIAKTEGKWIFCKHKERDTLEVPGGHRENGETIRETAERELKEETGAKKFHMEPVCAYSVKGEVRVRSAHGKTKVNGKDNEELYGMLFVAEVYSFEDLHSEIEKIIICEEMTDHWTYPQIQPRLLQEAKRRGYLSE